MLSRLLTRVHTPIFDFLLIFSDLFSILIVLLALTLGQYSTCCFSLCISTSLYVCFKISGKKTAQLIQTRSLKKYFQIYKQAVGKFAFG